MIKGEGTAFNLIRCKDEKEWLEQRKKGIGGSDVAVILGLSKFKNPIELYLEKTGRVEAPDISDKPAVQWGNILEPVVGEKYKEEHPEHIVKRVNAVASSIARPWAQASLDYEVFDGTSWGILEIKTAGLRVAEDWKDGIPLYYQTQITHYMSVLDRDYAIVAVLIGGNDYREYRIERDEEDVKVVNEAVDKFWNENVKAGVPPTVSPNSTHIPTFTDLFQDVDDEFIDVPIDDCGPIDELISEYQDVTSQLKELTERKKHLSSELMYHIKDKKGLITDTAKVTWVRSNKTHLNTTALKDEQPEIYERYLVHRVQNGGLRVKDL